MGKIDFLSCDEFKLIKKLMGISDDDKTEFTIVISADDPNLKSTSTGFTYRGRRVILYIRDQVQYGDKTSEYKFHLVDCTTLKIMRNQNRYGKYVVSTSTNGKFKVNRIINNRPTEIEAELHVCKNCLKQLRRRGYNFAYKNFSIEEFFRIMEDNSGNFHYLPTETDSTAPTNVYPKDWDKIARRFKEKHNYTCQECGKKSPSVEVHHKNELKWDCSESNLEVLCRDCHQTKHSHNIHPEKS